MQRAIHDVAATVARMREFYRQREPQLNLAPVQLNELVAAGGRADARALERHAAAARRRHRPARPSSTPNLPVMMGVESEIRDALTNLVFNAVDAMPRGRRADAAHARRRVRATCMVEVSDTGVGMDEDTRRRCLEPFFTTKGERGTGLGLAMVYGMVQRHSADIDIDSVVGRGTTVALEFRGRRQRGAQRVLGARSRYLPACASWSWTTIRCCCGRCATRSRPMAMSIETANGGREGIDRFRKRKEAARRSAVVLTDLGMPFVDGRQVASAIKAESPATPVIMLTGWGQRLVAEGDMPAHVDIVLSKPPKLRDLREALGRSCATR